MAPNGLEHVVASNIHCGISNDRAAAFFRDCNDGWPRRFRPSFGGPIPNDMPRIDEGSADSTEAQRVGRVARPANFGWNALRMQSRHELISLLRSGHVDVRSTYLVLQPLIADRSSVQSSFQTSAYHLAPCVGEPRPRHDLFHALLICAPRSKRVVTGGGGGVNVPRSPRAHPCGPTTALDASMSLRP